MTEFTRPLQIGSYALGWESKKFSDLAKVVAKMIAKLGLSLLVHLATGGKLKLLEVLWSAAKGTYNLKEISKLFNEAKKTAKITGTLLACCLAIGYPLMS